MTAVAETLSPAAEKLRERLGSSTVGERARVADLDLATIEVSPADWPALARFLRDDPECRYDLFLDLLGVDNLRRRGPRPRFEAVAHLHSLPRNEHVRVRIPLPDPEKPRLPTVSDVYPAADWFEREAYDMFGFDFAGHPHTTQLKTVERYTRTDAGTLENVITITDPGAYKKPFTVKFTATLRPGWDLMEYICNENNQDVEQLKGPAGL